MSGGAWLWGLAAVLCLLLATVVSNRRAHRQLERRIGELESQNLGPNGGEPPRRQLSGEELKVRHQRFRGILQALRSYARAAAGLGELEAVADPRQDRDRR